MRNSISFYGEEAVVALAFISRTNDVKEPVSMITILTGSSGRRARRLWTGLVAFLVALLVAGIAEAQERSPVRDFDFARAAAGNEAPTGMWSNGTTLWVADWVDDKLYSYHVSTRARDFTREFDSLRAAGNQSPTGLWSDGTTMWVADNEDGKLYAYSLTTRTRDASKDFDTLTVAGNSQPAGLWSDGTTMWVGDYQDVKLFAYDLRTRARSPAQDFDTLNQYENDTPRGL